MAKKLVDRIWDISPDNDWEHVAAPKANGLHMETSARRVLRMHIELILKEIKSEYPIIDSLFVSITGISPGFFVVVASTGRDMDTIPDCPQNAPTTLAAKFLLDPNASLIQHVSNPATYAEFTGDPSTKSKVLMKLIAGGELYGFMSLESKETDTAPKELLRELESLQPYLSRVIAESVFTMRLWDLAKPLFKPNQGTLNELCHDITQRALLAFGGSGSILRLLDAEDDSLTSVAFSYIDENAADVIEELITPESIGEDICNAVLLSKDFDWAVGQVDKKNESKIHGMPVPREMEKQMDDLGVSCFSIFRIESYPETETGAPLIMGTLSIFHLHPTRYSWRDVALAKQLVKRSADVLLLQQQTTELKNTKSELEATVDLLELEGEMATRAEVVTLLSHDLGHKALAIQGWLEDYIAAVKKSLRTNRAFPSIEKITQEGELAVSALLAGMNTVNKLFTVRGEAQNREFNLFEAVDEVKKTLDAALTRNSCACEYKDVVQNVFLKGNRNIFLLAIFNLIINSIDAQKTRRTHRPMTISISVRPNINRLTINFSDNGPGINRQIFPDANDIFELGKSSKPKGTGRGLTISRNLLGQFYGAELLLIDPSSAQFRIVFPKESGCVIYK